MNRAKNYLETLLFLALTLSLYFLYLITIPIFREPHGLLAMSELSDLTQSGFVLGLIFASSVVCVLSGTLLMNWVPILSPGMMAHFWSATYFYIWIDSVFSLSLQSKSYTFSLVMTLGIVFIHLYFFTLGTFQSSLLIEKIGDDPNFKMVQYWIWGWMGFYLGLSGFLAIHSLEWEGFRILLAIGAMILCFIYYLMLLFLKKHEGKDLAKFSSSGRIIFTAWILGLALVGLGGRWFL